MKFQTIFPFMSFIIFTFSLTNICLASIMKIAKRDAIGQNVANTFAQMNASITAGLQQAKSTSHNGPPNFEMITGGLQALVLLSKAADDELIGLGTNVLIDQEPSLEIQNSLYDSSIAVYQISLMIEQGKTYFEQNQAIEKVVGILKKSSFYATKLFVDLNLHRPLPFATSYSQSEGLFLCSIINATAILDNVKVSSLETSTCIAGAEENYATFDPNSFQGLYTLPTFTRW